MPRTGVELKPPWRIVPRLIRDAVADILGSTVARGMRVWGGYGPSPTFRLRLADGRRVFLKGCSPAASERMRADFRHELSVYEQLREQLGNWAPVTYGHYSAGGWDVLILEDLGPKSVPPWTPHLARSITRSFAAFHAAVRGSHLPPWVERPGAWLDLQGHLWEWASDRDAVAGRAAVAGARAAEATDWLATAIPVLSSVAARLLNVQTPPQLLHGDARSDNLRWKDQRLYLVDWAKVVAGPAEFDLAFFAQSIAAESGPEPEKLVEWYAEVEPFDPALLDAAVCAAAGFFADRGWREEVPGSPRLRTFQRRQFLVSLKWALRRLGIKLPRWLTAATDAIFDDLERAPNAPRQKLAGTRRVKNYDAASPRGQRNE